jgi:hypothetical protein
MVKLTEPQARLLENIMMHGGARYYPYWSGNPASYAYANGAGGTLRMPSMKILIDKGMLEKTQFTKFRGHVAVPTELAKQYLEIRERSKRS